MDMYSAKVYSGCDIALPERRVVHYRETLYKQLQLCIDRLSFKDSVIQKMYTSVFKTPFLLLLEYLPHLEVMQHPEQARRMFDSGEPASRRKVIRLGMAMGVDLLMANKARLLIHPEHSLYELHDLQFLGEYDYQPMGVQGAHYL